MYIASAARQQGCPKKLIETGVRNSDGRRPVSKPVAWIGKTTVVGGIRARPAKTTTIVSAMRAAKTRKTKRAT